MAYSEFYCQNGGSNLNAGSTTNNTATYTSIHGNWTNATGVFTPTDGTTPASTVSVGMFASVYIDGATVGVYIGRISAVGAGVNGAITANTSGIGSKPANQTATATIKVGGAWQGPNGASGFPLTLASFGNNQDTNSDKVRLNLKNDQTYTVTGSFAVANTGSSFIVQGYTSSVGDLGKATFDGTTNTGAIVTQAGPAGAMWTDCIFVTSISSGTTTLFTTANVIAMVRCVFHGARNFGLNMSTAGGSAQECEFYDNNKANTAGIGGVTINASSALRCISHDNTGSNTAGFIINGGPCVLTGCIADTNGGIGISVTNGSANGVIQIQNCDIYNNGSDGINIVSGNLNQIWIENTNLIKNTSKGINNVATTNFGFIYNCGYGAGTQANGSADTINNLSQSGTVTYGSNLTPWVDPANGDFRVNLAAANYAGRGTFTETASSYAGAAGHPDIGSCQSLTGPTGTFSKEVSYSSPS